jgi:hypothetical protein
MVFNLERLGQLKDGLSPSMIGPNQGTGICLTKVIAESRRGLFYKPFSFNLVKRTFSSANAEDQRKGEI